MKEHLQSTPFRFCQMLFPTPGLRLILLAKLAFSLLGAFVETDNL